MEKRPEKPEIITISSGKGGTGKTLITSCLGWVLTRIGKRVLLIDGDPGTDGLSLFLLGTEGMKHINDYVVENTFVGALQNFSEKNANNFMPREINRSGKKDHKVFYSALISGKTLYGEFDENVLQNPVTHLDRKTFQSAIMSMFNVLRNQENKYDYVLVDTRGGFASETTDICALSDSFIVVTEPDYTSFFQDRNLIGHISITAKHLGNKPLLRAIIVNKATEVVSESRELDLINMEQSFRLELEKEFPIPFSDTHPIPLNIDAVKAYKTHAIPFLMAPASHFSFALLSAFSAIMKIVTVPWTKEEIEKWNKISEDIDDAIQKKNKAFDSQITKQQNEAKELNRLRSENEKLIEKKRALEGEVQEVRNRYERELERAQFYIKDKSKPSVTLKSMGTWWAIIATVIAVVLGIFVVSSLFSKASKGKIEPSAKTNIKQIDQYSVEEAREILYKSDVSPEIKTILVLKLYHDGMIRFDKADLSYLDLSRQRISGASFRGADLSGVNFKGADLSRIDFTGAIMNRTDLRGANLKGAIIFSEQLKAANTDSTTIIDLPSQKKY